MVVGFLEMPTNTGLATSSSVHKEVGFDPICAPPRSNIIVTARSLEL